MSEESAKEGEEMSESNIFEQAVRERQGKSGGSVRKIRLSRKVVIV